MCRVVEGVLLIISRYFGPTRLHPANPELADGVVFPTFGQQSTSRAADAGIALPIDLFAFKLRRWWLGFLTAFPVISLLCWMVI